MKMRRFCSYLFILSLSVFPLRLSANDDPAASSPSFAVEGVNHIKSELAHVRLSEEDVKLPQGWVPNFTIDTVENLFGSPLQTPAVSSRFLSRLESGTTLKSVMDLFEEMIFSAGRSTWQEQPATSFPPPQHLPDDLKAALREIFEGLARATPHLQAAVSSIPLEEQKAFLNFMEIPAENGIVKQEISSRRIHAMVNVMKNFKEDEMARAGKELFHALDQALPLLAGLSSPPATQASRITWKTPHGDILIGGRENDTYGEEDLRQHAVILDLGGSNSYIGPAAGARSGEIRLVIDLGSHVTVETRRFSDNTVASGIFGIGVMVLPNANGLKKISAGSFSQGCGIAGVGGLIINGRTELKTDRYGQGVGAFGLGLLKINNGTGSTFELTRNGQGAGFVRGVGIFTLSGDTVTIKGGLVEPDPREPLGSVSICQGMGSGRRGYAGGGIGIMALRGNRINVEGSYFAQGCGYWHSLGIFRLTGNDSQIQARRYAQGTGVHFAFGHFEMKGGNNRILNWGVGPAFGWDRGLGSALFEGNGNELQVEWGAGSSAIGSWSFSFLRGNNNLLKIPQWGDGNFYRNEPARSIHVILGENNIMQAPVSHAFQGKKIYRMGTPWGICAAQGVSLKPDLNLKSPEWARLTIEDFAQREMVDLASALKNTSELKGRERVAQLIDIASAFSLDKTNPRKALEELVTLPKGALEDVIELYDPAAVDALIKLQIVLAGHGENSAHAILSRLDSFPPHKRALLINELAALPPSETVSALLKQLNKTSDDLSRLSAVRVLGQMLNADTGHSPGIRAVLEAVANHLKSRRKLEEEPKALLKMLQRLTVAESMGILSTSLALPNPEKIRFLSKAPEQVNETLTESGAKEFVKIINENAAAARKNVGTNLKILRIVEAVVQENLYALLSSTNSKKVEAAVIALGQMAHAEDAPLLKPFLHHGHAGVREAAAVALGRMGEAGFPILKATMDSVSSITKNLALSSIPHAVSPRNADLILIGLDDPDPMVRLNAAVALKNLSPAIEPLKEELIRKARLLAAQESDPSVLLALQILK